MVTITVFNDEAQRQNHRKSLCDGKLTAVDGPAQNVE